MLIEKYIRHILAQLQKQDFTVLFQPLTEANMNADTFDSLQKYVVINANGITCTTGCDTNIGNFWEQYRLQILFLEQHPQDQDWIEFQDIMTRTEQQRRNFLYQITADQYFAEGNRDAVEFGMSQPWIKQFDANLSGWSLDLSIRFDVARYCYDCCKTPERFNDCEGEAVC